MRRYRVFLLILGLMSPAWSQTPPRKVVSSPQITPPSSALESGIGGKVSVNVAVDPTGRVIKVIEVIGPDWVCVDVDRPDVLALRGTAKGQAGKVIFAHGESPSSEWIGFTFPAKRSIIGDAVDTTLESFTSNPRLTIGKLKKLSSPDHLYSSHVEAGNTAIKVKIAIDERGKVFWAEPIEGHRSLVAGAHRAACTSEFRPTLFDGKPVKIMAILTYSGRR